MGFGVYEPMPFPKEVYLLLILVIVAGFGLYGAYLLGRHSFLTSKKKYFGYRIFPLDLDDYHFTPNALPEWALSPSREIGFEAWKESLREVEKSIGCAGLLFIGKQEAIEGLIVWRPFEAESGSRGLVIENFLLPPGPASLTGAKEALIMASIEWAQNNGFSLCFPNSC